MEIIKEIIKENIEVILLAVIIMLLLIKPLTSGIKWLKNRSVRSKKPSDKKESNNINKFSEVEQFLNILPKLGEEIKALQEYKEKAGNYDQLKINYEVIETEKQTLTTEKSDLETQLVAIQQELEAKNTEVANKLQEIETQNTANKELLEKVKKVEYLKDYAGKVYSYIAFIETIIDNANDQCMDFDKKDVETAKIMSALLQQALLATSEMAKWKLICEDIKTNGVVVLNNVIKNCFQPDDETERLNAFKKKCISELKTYTNAVLILCESYGNLSKFVANAEVSSLENDFKQKQTRIINKAKETGIKEIAEVNMFTNIDIDINKGAKAGSGEVTFPYLVVKDLNKDDIQQIIEFGMKTEFEDVTETKVLMN
jgi:hypothetical protein